MDLYVVLAPLYSDPAMQSVADPFPAYSDKVRQVGAITTKIRYLPELQQSLTDPHSFVII